MIFSVWVVELRESPVDKLKLHVVHQHEGWFVVVSYEAMTHLSTRMVDHYIAWLNIAVNNTMRVGEVQSLRTH